MGKKKKKVDDSVALLADALSRVLNDSVQAAVQPLRDDMRKMEGRLNARIDKQDEKIAVIGDQIVEMNGKIVEMDGKITEMDGKITEMDGKITEMDGKIAEINGNIEGMQGRLDILEKQIQTTNENMAVQFAEQEKKIGKLLKGAGSGSDSNGPGKPRHSNHP